MEEPKMRDLKTFYVNSLRECLYVLSSAGKECVIVDPGCQNARERARVDDYIAEEGLRPVCILLTHGHFDHVLSVSHFAEKYGIPAVMNAGDCGLLSHLNDYTNLFGMLYNGKYIRQYVLLFSNFSGTVPNLSVRSLTHSSISSGVNVSNSAFV